MKVSTHPLSAMAGAWSGTNHLWLGDGKPVRESESTGRVDFQLEDRVLSFRYTWSDHGVPQQGLLLVQHDPGTGVATAAWTDTWHMAHTFMHMDGRLELDGRLDLLGSYAAPPGPDWGWRITIDPADRGTFRLRMYNIAPGGPSEIAVDTSYHR